MADNTSKKELKRLTAITKIHHSVGANLQLAEISRILVRELVGLFACDGCAMMLIEEDKVSILAERGFSKTLGSVKFDTTMPAIQHILNTRESIFTNDIRNSPAASCLPTGCSMNSLICVPITVNNEVRGIIHLDSSKKNAFHREDLGLIELLAKEISIAMERCFIYSEILDTSTRDGLTGCFNRRKFDVDITAEIATAKHHGKPLSLFMSDIDWFKQYNDFHGHPKGDTLLKKLVVTLSSNIRPLDKVYRYGGEEFAILLPETTKENALSTAIRIQKAVEQEQFEGEKESQPNKRVTISIGVSTFPLDANDRDQLLKAADLALYEAKHSGRNQVHVFSNKL